MGRGRAPGACSGSLHLPHALGIPPWLEATPLGVGRVPPPLPCPTVCVLEVPGPPRDARCRELRSWAYQVSLCPGRCPAAGVETGRVSLSHTQPALWNMGARVDQVPEGAVRQEGQYSGSILRSPVPGNRVPLGRCWGTSMSMIVESQLSPTPSAHAQTPAPHRCTCRSSPSSAASCWLLSLSCPSTCGASSALWRPRSASLCRTSSPRRCWIAAGPPCGWGGVRT